MGDWYYVTYLIGKNGGLSGHGSIPMELHTLPRHDTDDVMRFSQQITESLHQQGKLDPEAAIIMTAWSKMLDDPRPQDAALLADLATRTSAEADPKQQAAQDILTKAAANLRNGRHGPLEEAVLTFAKLLTPTQ